MSDNLEWKIRNAQRDFIIYGLVSTAVAYYGAKNVEFLFNVQTFGQAFDNLKEYFWPTPTPQVRSFFPPSAIRQMQFSSFMHAGEKFIVPLYASLSIMYFGAYSKYSEWRDLLKVKDQ